MSKHNKSNIYNRIDELEHRIFAREPLREIDCFLECTRQHAFDGGEFVLPEWLRQSKIPIIKRHFENRKNKSEV